MVNNWKKLLFASLVCVCSCYSKNMLILFPGCLLNFWAHGTTIVTFRSRDKLSDYFILLLFPHLSGSTIKLMVSIPPYPLQNITVFIPLVWFPPSLSNTSASYLTLPFNASLPSSLSSLCQVFFFFFFWHLDLIASLSLFQPPFLFHLPSPPRHQGSWVQNHLLRVWWSVFADVWWSVFADVWWSVLWNS